MADPPTVGELLKAKVVTSEQVEDLAEEVLRGQLMEEAALTAAYVLNLAVAIRENRFATAVLRDKTTSVGARKNAVRTAILLARAQYAGQPEGHAANVASDVPGVSDQPVAHDQNDPAPAGSVALVPVNSIPPTARSRRGQAQHASQPDGHAADVAAKNPGSSDHLVAYGQNGPDPAMLTSSPLMSANSMPATIHRRWAQTRPFAGVSNETLEHKLRSVALQPHVRDLVRRELALRARAMHKK